MIFVMNQSEKIYIVEFVNYTTCWKDTVSLDGEYLQIPEGGLLVRESELEKYRKFGHGYKNIELVGSIYPVMEESTVEE